MLKINLILVFIIFFAACKNTSNEEQHEAKDTVSLVNRAVSPIPVNPKVEQNAKNIFTDTVTFMEYDDNGDYPLFFVEKGNKKLTFISNIKGEIKFLRDDQLSIQWKIDSAWISGEGEKLEMREWIISAKKIKDGSVSLYRKQHHKPIKYWHANKDDYSDTFKDYLYNWVQYYLANTKNILVMASLKANEDLSYSIEDSKKNGRAYTMLGLSSGADGHANIMVWLYLDNETRRFYEYDLANDKLVAFR
ncbi:MAG: hypothetical protein EOP00_11210 [Pedobacter sp.]|nr:MAG: hypothetical protein EOP00_11210 [Pedobacter sp.]